MSEERSYGMAKKYGPVGYTEPGGGMFSPSGTSTTTSSSSSKSDSGIDGRDIMNSLIANRARKNLEGIYTENRYYKKMISEESYGRSLPKGTTGAAGSVFFDEETEIMLMESES